MTAVPDQCDLKRQPGSGVTERVVRHKTQCEYHGIGPHRVLNLFPISVYGTLVI
jgi:hypothetical protein